MRRAIVHIGMPRTASTTVQHILARLRPELAEAGILYPDLTPGSAAHEPHISHQHFGEALDGRRPRREAEELLQRLSAELDRTDADVVLLSYEDFIQQKKAPQISRLLRSAFDRHGFRMEAVVVAKPQSELLNSIYSHRMQLMREKRAFADFATLFERSGRFAYCELIEPWLAACEGRVRAIPLRDRRSPAPIVDRFMAELGLSDRVAPLLGADDLARVENRSPGPVAVEVSRRLRSMRVHARVRVRPREMMRFVERAALERGFDGVPFKGVGPELRARMNALFAETNGRFATALWGQPWSAVVAPEPGHPVNEIAGRPVEPAIERHVDAILRDACRQFDVMPVRPWRSGPVELLLDGGEALQRALRISRWRVI